MLADHRERSQLIVDYVLGLLPAEAQTEMENHLATCDPCRLAVQRERALAAEVRHSVASATRPAPGRLRHLMPQPPTRRLPLPLLNHAAWRPLLALALLVLFLGVFQSDLSPRRSGDDALLSTPAATTLVATATTTPTATHASATPAGEVPGPASPVPADLFISPPPPRSPMAALPASPTGS